MHPHVKIIFHLLHLLETLIFFFQDTKTVIDLTNEVLADDNHVALSLIHRLAEEKIRGRKIIRLTSIIRSSRYFMSKFHKNKEM